VKKFEIVLTESSGKKFYQAKFEEELALLAIASVLLATHEMRDQLFRIRALPSTAMTVQGACGDDGRSF
jgi:hypothetical protein